MGSLAVPSAAETDSAIAYGFLEAEGINFTGVIVIYDELHVAGVQAAGYVPMLEDQDEINLITTENFSPYGDVANGYRSVVLHEYAHILQKRVLEANCGASYGARALCLPQLESLLAAYGDQSEHPETTLLPGLETSADCILDTYGAGANLHGYQQGHCSVDQLAAALAIRNGEWPDETTVASYQEQAQVLLAELSNTKGLGKFMEGKKSGFLEKSSRKS